MATDEEPPNSPFHRFNRIKWTVLEPADLKGFVKKSEHPPPPVLPIGDTERRSGLYVLGKPGFGKSSLMVNLANEDVKKGHGLFFLDPHGEAITDLLRRGDDDQLTERAILLNPEDEGYSFGINLLACPKINSLKARTDTYARAYNVFQKLFASETGEWGPWLQLIIQYTLPIFIEVQDYTLAEMPRFLTNHHFREHLFKQVKHNKDAVEFWQQEFQPKQAEAALTRVRTLLGHPYVRHIIGQQKTTIDFAKIMDERQILLVKLSLTSLVTLKSLSAPFLSVNFFMP